MTATPPDPLATQHDGTPDHDDQGPVDSQTRRLREENRALRELLAAQVHASLPRQEPGWFKRLCWWLISAPGAALVGWRSLLGRDEAEPMTRRRVGCATLTVLYTLAIYAALVLLVVSWNSPSTPNSGATAASPVRVPLAPSPPLPMPPEPDVGSKGADATPDGATQDEPSRSASPAADTAPSAPAMQPAPAMPDTADSASAAPAPAASAAQDRQATAESPHAPSAPHPTLRITEIPAPDPMAWVAALDGELARCAELGFFERPDCAWTARKQYCEANNGWGVVKECPAQP